MFFLYIVSDEGNSSEQGKSRGRHYFGDCSFRELNWVTEQKYYASDKK